MIVSVILPPLFMEVRNTIQQSVAAVVTCFDRAEPPQWLRQHPSYSKVKVLIGDITSEEVLMKKMNL